MPVSFTVNSRVAVSASCSSKRIPITTSPSSVNFTALFPRLTNICPTLNGSPCKAIGISAGISNKSSIFFSSVLIPIRLARLSNTSSSLNSISSISSFPASILEKSRISLIMPNNDSAERCTFST